MPVILNASFQNEIWNFNNLHTAVLFYQFILLLSKTYTIKTNRSSVLSRSLFRFLKF